MRNASHTFRRTYLFASDRLLLGCVAFYALTAIFEGPLRLGLFRVGAGSALYVRDLVIAVPVMVAVAAWLAGQASAVPVPAVLGLLLAHLMIGIFTLPSTFQALFGLKIFLPLLCGVAIAPLLRKQPDALIKFCRLTLVATAIGVGLNLFVDYPWIGLSYDTAFGETSAARQWWSAGELRLPGFTRGSTAAASIALVCLVPLLLRSTSWKVRAGWILLASATIFLTTSKGPMMTIPALVIEIVLLTRFNSLRPSLVYIWSAAVVCLAVPLIAVNSGASHDDVPRILHSFIDRIVDIWPRAFELLDWQSLLWGRGLGGIGTPQTFGEWARVNSADNFMVYILVAFGVLGPLYVVAIVLRVSRVTAEGALGPFELHLSHAWLLVWFVHGFTTNMLEDAIATLSFGVIVGSVMGVPARQPSSVRQSDYVPRRWSRPGAYGS